MTSAITDVDNVDPSRFWTAGPPAANYTVHYLEFSRDNKNSAREQSRRDEQSLIPRAAWAGFGEAIGPGSEAQGREEERDHFAEQLS